MGAEYISTVLTKIMLKFWVFLFVLEFVFCYSYPMFGSRQYLQAVPIQRSAYLPLPDYEDEFVVNSPEDYEYSPIENYPYVQYYGYYPSDDYYRDKATGGFGNFEYFDDRIPPNSEVESPGDPEKDDIYPYEEEVWYEEEHPEYERKQQTDFFLQNLILAQMYQNAKNQHPFDFELIGDDYDERPWFYGIPMPEIDEENARKFFGNIQDKEVKELESLALKKGKSQQLKEKAPYKNQNFEMIEKPTKPKSKMTDDEYFDMQKQIIVNNRKNSNIPLARGLRLSKKQTYNPVDVKNNLWNFHKRNLPSYLESATNSIKKLNLNKNAKSTTELGVSDSKMETSSKTVSSTPATKRPVSVGQKEFVLPRPSNPVRRPFPEMSSRSLHKPSVYDRIKQMLKTDKDLQTIRISKPHKRFVLNEDQLTTELSGLKKLSA